MMLAVSEPEAKIVAILHDVVEDSDWTFERLAGEGFSADVIAALEGVTRREGERYDAFIERAAGNPVAAAVKLADLEDNMKMTRLARLEDRDLARLTKYHSAWRRLHHALEARVARSAEPPAPAGDPTGG